MLRATSLHHIHKNPYTDAKLASQYMMQRISIGANHCEQRNTLCHYKSSNPET